ncbi:hypothetical protein B0H11DRAFT_1349341 [Mycena galericulata]|nr:hypothetical protein B0H11DRAFT_1349341 [Mycena galericulata]
MKSRKGKEYCRSRSSSPETLAFKTPSEKASQVSTPKRKRCRDSQDDEVDDRRESKRAKTIERSVASSSRFPPTRLPPPPSPTWSESAFPRVYNPVSVDLAYQGMQPPSRRHEGLTPFQLEAARHGWQGMVSSSRSVPPAANVRYPAPHANFTLPSPSSPSSKSLSNGRTESTTAKDPLEVPQPETGSFPLPLNSRQRRREPSATTRDQNPASRVQTRTARGASTHIAPPTKGVSPRKLSDGEGWAEVFELDRGPVLDSSGKRKREDSDDLDFSSKKTKPTNARKRGRESDYSDEPLVPKKTNKAKTKNTSRSLLSLLSSHHSTPETVGHARANRSSKKPTKPTRNSNPRLQKCKKASKGKHMCPECDKTYSRKSDVARHSEVIHQGKVKSNSWGTVETTTEKRRKG